MHGVVKLARHIKSNKNYAVKLIKSGDPEIE